MLMRRIIETFHHELGGFIPGIQKILHETK